MDGQLIKVATVTQCKHKMFNHSNQDIGRNKMAPGLLCFFFLFCCQFCSENFNFNLKILTLLLNWKLGQKNLA